MIDCNTDTPQSLCTILREFYASARKKDGTSYKKNTLNGIRYGLSRHYKLKRGWDIINDVEFTSANEMYSSRIAEMKRQGFGGTTHYPEIVKDDLDRIYSQFDLNNPKSLQRKVQFDVQFFLCRRGRENLRSMKKDHFSIERDGGGRLFVFQRQDEEDKNHKEDDDETIGEGRMYERPGLYIIFKCTKNILN